MVTNNPFDSVKPSEESVKRMNDIRLKAKELYDLIQKEEINSTEKSMAKIHLQESVMWANKAIVFNQK